VVDQNKDRIRNLSKTEEKPQAVPSPLEAIDVSSPEPSLRVEFVQEAVFLAQNRLKSGVADYR
jgi:hypothetical protein